MLYARGLVWFVGFAVDLLICGFWISCLCALSGYLILVRFGWFVLF